MEFIENTTIRSLANPGVISRQLLSPHNSRSKRVTITEVHLEPGASQPRHTHETSEQIWYALEGAGTLLLAGGEERVDISSSEAVSVSDHRGDYWGGAAEAEEHVILRPGCFLVLFPGDAHRPGMAVDTPKGVSRIVFKIRVKEN